MKLFYIIVLKDLDKGEVRQWPTPVLLPGKSHGWRSLVGCSPCGRKESDTTEQLHFHFSLSCIGHGNGNPLQCSCLENPRDGRAWWAAVYGVTQSQTRLKWLSSSSSSLPFRIWHYREFLCVTVVQQFLTSLSLSPSVKREAMMRLFLRWLSSQISHYNYSK